MAHPTSPPGTTVTGTNAILGAASIITVAFMGSVVVSPLYPLYQRDFGFSGITLTLVYATYAVGNVVALMVFGQVSDQIGRKRAALPGLGLAAVGGLCFLLAHGTALLFVGRLLSGLAVGICSGTGTSWLAELYGAERRATATLAATTANLTGIAAGPFVGGLLAGYGPSPLRLPLVVYLAAVVASALVVAFVAETRTARIGSLRQLRARPRLGVPREILTGFAPPAVTAFVIFSLGGLYFSLIPGIAIRDLHETNVAFGGLVICELGAVATVCIWLGRRLPPATAMSTGLVTILPAAVLVVAAQWRESATLLIIASALAGVALATGYRGSLELVNQMAPDERRGEVVSTYFIACFLGNSVPVIGIGVLTSTTSPLTASVCFAALIVVLAVAALLWRSAYTRTPAAPST